MSTTSYRHDYDNDGKWRDSEKTTIREFFINESWNC